jgi:hypothetical protein
MFEDTNLMDIIRKAADSDHSWDAHSIKEIKEVHKSHPEILDQVLIAITGWSYETLNVILKEETT